MKYWSQRSSETTYAPYGWRFITYRYKTQDTGDNTYDGYELTVSYDKDRPVKEYRAQFKPVQVEERPSGVEIVKWSPFARGGGEVASEPVARFNKKTFAAFAEQAKAEFESAYAA